jgi:hypothetical protein
MSGQSEGRCEGWIEILPGRNAGVYAWPWAYLSRRAANGCRPEAGCIDLIDLTEKFDFPAHILLSHASKLGLRYGRAFGIEGWSTGLGHVRKQGRNRRVSDPETWGAHAAAVIVCSAHRTNVNSGKCVPPAPRRTQQGQAPVTTARNEMQVALPVIALQLLWHETSDPKNPRPRLRRERGTRKRSSGTCSVRDLPQ